VHVLEEEHGTSKATTQTSFEPRGIKAPLPQV
jgi:hypothetical protein